MSPEQRKYVAYGQYRDPTRPTLIVYVHTAS